MPPALTGVWRIVRTRTLETDGTVINHPGPYGEFPFGMVNFTKERMVATVGDMAGGNVAGRKWLTWVTDFTGREALRHLDCAGTENSHSDDARYGGPYTFDGKTLITSPDLASQPDRMVDQVRDVRFEGDLMVLSPPARMDTGLGRIVKYELFWEKLGD